jgi:hypothetical protein
MQVSPTEISMVSRTTITSLPMRLGARWVRRVGGPAHPPELEPGPRRERGRSGVDSEPRRPGCLLLMSSCLMPGFGQDGIRV